MTAVAARILMVDDEPRRVEAYRFDLALEMRCPSEDCEVALVDSAETGLNRAIAEEWDVVVVDVMMAHQDSAHFTAEATKNGAYTGIVLYQHLRRAKPTQPIIVFSNTRASEILGECADIARDPRCCVLQKTQTLPFELTRRVLSLAQRQI